MIGFFTSSLEKIKEICTPYSLTSTHVQPCAAADASEMLERIQEIFNIQQGLSIQSERDKIFILNIQRPPRKVHYPAKELLKWLQNLGMVDYDARKKEDVSRIPLHYKQIETILQKCRSQQFSAV